MYRIKQCVVSRYRWRWFGDNIDFVNWDEACIGGRDADKSKYTLTYYVIPEGKKREISICFKFNEHREFIGINGYPKYYSKTQVKKWECEGIDLFLKEGIIEEV